LNDKHHRIQYPGSIYILPYLRSQFRHTASPDRCQKGDEERHWVSKAYQQIVLVERRRSGNDSSETTHESKGLDD
jgi:hypothetical protein